MPECWLYVARDLAEIFAVADVFCIPGAVGLAINQAFYWGLPLVTIDGHHGPEIHYLRDGVNGFMAKDSAEMAERLLLLLNDDDLRQRMSVAARSTADREAGPDRMSQAFVKAAQDALRERDSRVRKSRRHGL